MLGRHIEIGLKADPASGERVAEAAGIPLSELPVKTSAPSRA